MSLITANLMKKKYLRRMKMRRENTNSFLNLKKYISFMLSFTPKKQGTMKLTFLCTSKSHSNSIVSLFSNARVSTHNSYSSLQ
jgi:hypothetical protein